MWVGVRRTHRRLDIRTEGAGGCCGSDGVEGECRRLASKGHGAWGTGVGSTKGVQGSQGVPRYLTEGVWGARKSGWRERRGHGGWGSGRRTQCRWTEGVHHEDLMAPGASRKAGWGIVLGTSDTGHHLLKVWPQAPVGVLWVRSGLIPPAP